MKLDLDRWDGPFGLLLVFAAMGPPVGFMSLALVFLFVDLIPSGGVEIAELPGFLLLALAAAFVSYVFGLIPATLTGGAACLWARLFGGGFRYILLSTIAGAAISAAFAIVLGGVDMWLVVPALALAGAAAGGACALLTSRRAERLAPGRFDH